MPAFSRTARNIELQPPPVSANVQRSDQQRRRARRNAWLLAVVAAGFYAAFIVMSLHSRHG